MAAKGNSWHMDLCYDVSLNDLPSICPSRDTKDVGHVAKVGHLQKVQLNILY